MTKRKQPIWGARDSNVRRTLAICFYTAAAVGCGTYNENPVAGPQATAVAPPGANPIPAMPGAPPGMPGGPIQRRRLDQVGVKRVPLTNVVGVFLNAKASINQRMLSLNAHSVAEQFKGANGRYPNDYAELEVQLKAEGKQLPDLQPGHRYVFDATDGNVYVESGG